MQIFKLPLSVLAFLWACFSCSTEPKDSITSISGFIDQPLVDSLTVYWNLESEVVAINQDGAFYIELDIDKPVFVKLDFGFDNQLVYIEPNVGLVMNVVGMMPSVHSSYEGGLAKENNFLSKSATVKKIRERFRKKILPDDLIIEASQWSSEMLALPMHAPDMSKSFVKTLSDFIGLLELQLVKLNHLKAQIGKVEGTEGIISFSLEEVQPFCEDSPFMFECIVVYSMYYKTEYMVENEKYFDTYDGMEYLKYLASQSDLQKLSVGQEVLTRSIRNHVLFEQKVEWTVFDKFMKKLKTSFPAYQPSNAIKQLITQRKAALPIQSIQVLTPDLELQQLPLDSGRIALSFCSHMNESCMQKTIVSKSKGLKHIRLVSPSVNVEAWYLTHKVRPQIVPTYFVTNFITLQRSLQFEDLWRHDLVLENGKVVERIERKHDN